MTKQALKLGKCPSSRPVVWHCPPPWLEALNKLSIPKVVPERPCKLSMVKKSLEVVFYQIALLFCRLGLHKGVRALR